MWKCEKYGRDFKNTNQNHYCKVKPESVDEYIDMFEGEKKRVLLKYRLILREALPQASEKLSWSMPTYYHIKNIIHFAGNKNHVGIYPGPKGVEKFKSEIEELGLKFTRGAIQIPYDMEVPEDFIKTSPIFL